MKLRLALPLTCLAAGAAGQPLGPRPTLHTPDVILPAVLPYLACLYAEHGLPLLRANDGSQVAYDKSSSDCSAARVRARADAGALLKGKAVPGGQSADEFIDAALADMDAYVATLPRGGQAEARSTVIGIPLTIEDEIQPAYQRYDECLKTQVSGSPVTPDTVIAKFKQAMSICASVRDLAVSEAARALAVKGWDEAKRAQTATTTFAKIDESWLAMGEQYRQAMLKHLARAGTPDPTKR